MKVGEMLKKLASSTGLIVFADSTNIPEVAVIQTRTISLQNLLEAKEETDPMSSAPELSLAFEKVLETMKVPAFAHGWTAKSVATYMQSEEMSRLGKQEAKQALMRVLQDNKVPLEDILTDAVNRDKALDVYEEFVQKKLRERNIKREAEMNSLEAQIKSLEVRIREAKQQQKQADEDFQEWLKSKIAEEEQLVKVVSLITNDSKISVGSISNRKETK